MKKLFTPIDETSRLSLKVGDEILLSGTIYTGRDQAHKLMVQDLKEGKKPPFDYENQVIYYVGPTPARPPRPIGACGPTSSYRMDSYSSYLMPKGLKMMIGKGERSETFKAELLKEKAIYFIAVGGIGALHAKRVKSSKMIAYPELLSEAIYQLEVEDFPVIVAYDTYGGDIFKKP